MAHFYGRVESWDVVNEALDQDCGGGMQDNVFFRKLGPGYVEDCFRVAHQVRNLLSSLSTRRTRHCVGVSTTRQEEVMGSFVTMLAISETIVYEAVSVVGLVSIA